jgi:hypothetical protein
MGQPEERPVTVEWGDDDDRRSRWWDRILGREPGGTAGGSNVVGITCAVTAFVLVLAALALPWVRFADVQRQPGSFGPAIDRMTVGQLFSFMVTAYVMSVVLVLACLGALFVVPGAARRLLGAVALGLTAGQVACVVGIAAAIKGGGDVSLLGRAESAELSFGEGVYAAFAAAVMFVGTVVIANWQPRRRHKADRPAREYDIEVYEIDEQPEGRGPIDLTVTPLRPLGDTAAERWSGR